MFVCESVKVFQTDLKDLKARITAERFTKHMRFNSARQFSQTRLTLCVVAEHVSRNAE